MGQIINQMQIIKMQNNLILNQKKITTKAGYVAIIGKPNAGKSTFLNSVIGTKLSIITPKPQTTRKRVLGICTEANIQIIFIDTPGVLNPKYAMQSTMMEYVHNSIEIADCIIYPLSILSEKSRKKFEVLNKYDFLKKYPKIIDH